MVRTPSGLGPFLDAAATARKPGAKPAEAKSGATPRSRGRGKSRPRP